MSCAGVRGKLGALSASALGREEARAARAHLSTCTACQAHERIEAAEADALGRAVAAPVLDPSAAARLVVAAEARLAATVRAGPRWKRYLAAASIMVAALGLGGLRHLWPCVRGECPTSRVLAQAWALTSEPALVAPMTVALQLPGGRAVGTVESIAGQRVERFDVTGVSVLRAETDPRAHVHGWATTTLADGRAYVDEHHDGRRLVAWVDADGRLWCCVGAANETERVARDLRAHVS